MKTKSTFSSCESGLGDDSNTLSKNSYSVLENKIDLRLLAYYRNKFDNYKNLIHSQDVDLFEKIKAELQCYSTEEDCAQLIKEIDSHFDELVNKKNMNDLKINYERIQIFIKSINDFAVLDFSKENAGIFKLIYELREHDKSEGRIRTVGKNRRIRP